MLQDAILKIKSEMDQNKNNQYIQVVGQFLLQHLNTNPGAAENIMAKDKTIGKSLDAMRNEASKKKVGNCAVLTDQEGFEVVLKYFGITRAVSSSFNTNAAANDLRTQPQVPVKKALAGFDLKLEDLL